MSDPIQARYRAGMNAVAEMLDQQFNGTTRPKKIAFVLLISEFGAIEDGRVNYISNADRADTITMMKEWIARAEGRYSEKGGKA
ncbi:MULTISPECIES: hypothetical protein [unclassified Sphingomonas]|uniref:hypothetical protein n=1 Tax=unclassified Sphingomonas TaxID=196159 RepID=UPI0006FF4003|nr:MULTISPECIES: hypothetical protein [unclassified Sphingomonas]KQX19370.1 hypothetical protein ASD17_12575 [Sphingomonas sp. Root1294]KQY65573.1 hypothetical protein ASD39_15775 [Sphingomonas sp. Root50]KRB95126.1 hypothetical protein ASE22_04280 [Sphingomonas sp. Root720]